MAHSAVCVDERVCDTDHNEGEADGTVSGVGGVQEAYELYSSHQVHFPFL